MTYSRRSVGLFVVIVLVFGGTFPAIKIGIGFIPPLLLAAFRYVISALLLLAYVALTRQDWRPRTPNDWIGVLAGGVLFIGGTGLSFVGIQFTTSGIAAIIFSLIPVLTVLFGWVLLPAERLAPRGFLGVLIGFVGVALVINPDPNTFAAVTVLGNVLVLLAAVSVTIGTILVRRAHPPMPVVSLTGWAMLIGAVILFTASVLLGESFSDIRVTPLAVATLGYLAVLAGGIGFVIFFKLLDQFGALEVNLVTYLNTVVALIIGSVYLEEPIVPLALVGMGIVFVGFGVLKNKELAAELARYRGAAR